MKNFKTILKYMFALILCLQSSLAFAQVNNISGTTKKTALKKGLNRAKKRKQTFSATLSRSWKQLKHWAKLNQKLIGISSISGLGLGAALLYLTCEDTPTADDDQPDQPTTPPVDPDTYPSSSTGYTPSTIPSTPAASSYKHPIIPTSPAPAPKPPKAPAPANASPPTPATPPAKHVRFAEPLAQYQCFKPNDTTTPTEPPQPASTIDLARINDQNATARAQALADETQVRAEIDAKAKIHPAPPAPPAAAPTPEPAHTPGTPAAAPAKKPTTQPKRIVVPIVPNFEWADRFTQEREPINQEVNHCLLESLNKHLSFSMTTAPTPQAAHGKWRDFLTFYSTQMAINFVLTDTQQPDTEYTNLYHASLTSFRDSLLPLASYHALQHGWWQGQLDNVTTQIHSQDGRIQITYPVFFRQKSAECGVWALYALQLLLDPTLKLSKAEFEITNKLIIDTKRAELKRLNSTPSSLDKSNPYFLTHKKDELGFASNNDLPPRALNAAMSTLFTNSIIVGDDAGDDVGNRMFSGQQDHLPIFLIGNIANFVKPDRTGLTETLPNIIYTIVRLNDGGIDAKTGKQRYSDYGHWITVKMEKRDTNIQVTLLDSLQRVQIGNQDFASRRFEFWVCRELAEKFWPPAPAS